MPKKKEILEEIEKNLADANRALEEYLDDEEEDCLTEESED